VTTADPARALWQLADALDVDLEAALAGLQGCWDHADRALASRSAGLALPCAAGCAACCTCSVRVTPLEFCALALELDRQAERPGFVARGLALAATHGPAIAALGTGQGDAAPRDAALAFRCPALGDDGRCLGYPARPMACRLFGASFADDGALYGCALTGAALAGREVTLPRARPHLQALRALPLSFMVQVLPYYVELLWPAAAAR